MRQRGRNQGGKVIASLKKYAVMGYKPITTDTQLEAYTEAVLNLDRKRRVNRQEKLAAELLTGLIEQYEEEHHAIAPSTPVQVITELMAAHNLRQRDLVPIFGTDSIVSEVLHGKRRLTLQHVRDLSERFHVSPAVFF